MVCATALTVQQPDGVPTRQLLILGCAWFATIGSRDIKEGYLDQAYKGAG